MKTDLLHRRAVKQATSVRLPKALVDRIDQDALRVGRSRNDAIEHYLVEGLRLGEPLLSTDDSLRKALERKP